MSAFHTGWLLSFSNMHFSFFHIFLWFNWSFLFITEKYFILRMCHNLDPFAYLYILNKSSFSDKCFANVFSSAYALSRARDGTCNPRTYPWPIIEPKTLWCAGRCSNQRVTWARAHFFKKLSYWCLSQSRHFKIW